MKNKTWANKGLARNKKPLRNIEYKIELSQLKDIVDKSVYEQYKFKELGYLVLLWRYQVKDKYDSYNFHGFITKDYLKELLGINQYAKFCQGKRSFIIQRRVDGKNIPK